MGADEDQGIAFIPINKITPLPMGKEHNVSISEGSFFQQSKEETKKPGKAGKKGPPSSKKSPDDVE